LENSLDIVAGFRPAPLDRPLHDFQRLLREQLHHANVVLDAPARTMLLLQSGTQLAKQRRQLPVAEDVGMVQRRRLTLQHLQIVLRIETLLVVTIRTRMPGDHLAAGHHRDVVYIALDGDGLKRGRPRHTVAVLVEAHGLILVHLGWLEDARIEGERRQ
jgi:hypothetical protein